MAWYNTKIAPPDELARLAARERQSQLTKPPGSLGRLEDVAEQFAAFQATAIPMLERIALRVYAADHGVTAQGVSAFPAEVTAQMIANFLAGGAAISVLADGLNADFEVINLGTQHPLPDAPGLNNVQLMPGTRDFTQEAAMPESVLEACLDAGRASVASIEAELFIAGEMGIGNTTAASALLAGFLQRPATEVAGRGTGIDDAALARKIEAIERGLALHGGDGVDWRGLLAGVGGLEIAAMAGAYVHCAQRGVPSLVDGFIATAAALAAVRINADVQPWLLASHRSAEAAHALALDALAFDPLLDLGMRLGEGSGAATAVPLLQAAVRLHAGMATFADAGVSE